MTAVVKEPLNQKGARVRCRGCGKLANTTRPCKSCGSLRHIVAIVRYAWPKNLDVRDALQNSRMKAVRQWKKQAGLNGRGRVPYIPELDSNKQRATLVYDFEGDDIIVTFYYREKPVKYPE